MWFIFLKIFYNYVMLGLYRLYKFTVKIVQIIKVNNTLKGKHLSVTICHISACELLLIYSQQPEVVF